MSGMVKELVSSLEATISEFLAVNKSEMSIPTCQTLALPRPHVVPIYHVFHAYILFSTMP